MGGGSGCWAWEKLSLSCIRFQSWTRTATCGHYLHAGRSSCAFPFPLPLLGAEGGLAAPVVVLCCCCYFGLLGLGEVVFVVHTVPVVDMYCNLRPWPLVTCFPLPPALTRSCSGLAAPVLVAAATGAVFVFVVATAAVVPAAV